MAIQNYNSGNKTEKSSNSNWTVGKRIYVLSAISAFITLVLGVLSIYVLTSINGNTRELKEAYHPEWRLSSQLQENVAEIGFTHLRYQLNYDEDLYDYMIVYFHKIDSVIDASEELSTKQNLTYLDGEIESLRNSANAYRSSIENFHSTTTNLIQAREAARRSFNQTLQILNETLSDLDTDNPIALAQLQMDYLVNRMDISKADSPEKLQVALSNLQNIRSNLLNLNAQLGNSFDLLKNEFDKDIELAQTLITLEEELIQRGQDAFEGNQDIYWSAVDINNAAQENTDKLGVDTSNITLRSIWIIGVIAFVSVICIAGIGMWAGISTTNVLKNIIHKLNGGAEQVNESSAQLSSSSQSLAESSSEQAASLQQTTSSLEEISSQTKQTTQNVIQVEQEMDSNAKPMVESGKQSMGKMIEAMNNIENSSAETSKIIKTIDDIAFQTNLLALNAAVEAARAGEAGKGFAVVAEEVRNLAQRSAEAAKNTSDLIEESQENSLEGSKIAEEMAEKLDNIALSVDSVHTLVREIAIAAKEQQTGIEEMGSVMHEMDKTVQGNASSSEQTASSAEELSSQANELNKLVIELATLAGATVEQSSHSVNHSSIKHQANVQSIFTSNKQQSVDRIHKNGNGAIKPSKDKFEELILFDETDDFEIIKNSF